MYESSPKVTITQSPASVGQGRDDGLRLHLAGSEQTLVVRKEPIMAESDAERIVRESKEIITQKREAYSESSKGAGGMGLLLAIVAVGFLWTMRK